VQSNVSIHVRNEIHFEVLHVKLSYKINKAWFVMTILFARIRYFTLRNTGYNVIIHLLDQSKLAHLL